MFFKKGVLRNLAKFTVKHLCQSLFIIKVAGPRLGTLIKKRLWHRCFLANFAKFLRTSFLTEKLRWLLLSMVYILLEFYVSYEFLLLLWIKPSRVTGTFFGVSVDLTAQNMKFCIKSTVMQIIYSETSQ